MRGKTLAGVIGLAILAAAGVAALVYLVLQSGRDAPSPPIRAEKKEEYPCPPAVKRRLSSTCYIGIDDKMYISTDIDGDGLYDSDEIRWFGTLDYNSRTFMNGRRIDQAPPGSSRPAPTDTAALTAEVVRQGKRMQETRMPQDERADSDADGLPDRWELEHLGHLNSGRNDDPDGDGLPNVVEFYRLSDPARADVLPQRLRPPHLRRFRPTTHPWAVNWDIASEEFWRVQDRLGRPDH